MSSEFWQKQAKTDPCLVIFQQTCDEINRRYRPGAAAWIAEHQPDIDKEITALDAGINEIWFAIEAGRATLKEFKDLVARWYRLHLKAIRMYAENNLVSANIQLAATRNRSKPAVRKSRKA